MITAIKKTDYTDFPEITVIFFYFLFLNIFLFQDIVLADSKEIISDEKKINISNTANESIRLNLDNFLGEDTSVRATGRLTEDYLYAKVGVEKKHFLGSPYFVGIDASARSWNDIEFDLSGGGADVYFGKNITKSTKANIKYRFDSFDVSDTDAMSEIDFRRHEGTNYTSALSLNLERFTLDDALYPTAGSRMCFVAEYALKFLGGDFNFSRYEANAGYFFTPFLDVTFGIHGKIGWMEDFGSFQDVPFFERYFAGSSNTVRGFHWGKAGPRDLQGTPLGGEVLVAGNLEARIPIYKKLKGVLFFDTGRGFNKMDEFGHIDLRESVGFGFRYLTPWVVLRADYGFVLDRKSGEDRGKLHLTLGMPF